MSSLAAREAVAKLRNSPSTLSVDPRGSATPADTGKGTAGGSACAAALSAAATRASTLPRKLGEEPRDAPPSDAEGMARAAVPARLGRRGVVGAQPTAEAAQVLLASIILPDCAGAAALTPPWRAAGRVEWHEAHNGRLRAGSAAKARASRVSAADIYQKRSVLQKVLMPLLTRLEKGKKWGYFSGPCTRAAGPLYSAFVRGKTPWSPKDISLTSYSVLVRANGRWPAVGNALLGS